MVICKWRQNWRTIYAYADSGFMIIIVIIVIILTLIFCPIYTFPYTFEFWLIPNCTRIVALSVVIILYSYFIWHVQYNSHVHDGRVIDKDFSFFGLDRLSAPNSVCSINWNTSAFTLRRFYAFISSYSTTRTLLTCSYRGIHFAASWRFFALITFS
jgi:hypothetical protein